MMKPLFSSNMGRLALGVGCWALSMMPARAVQMDAFVGFGFKPETTKFRNNSYTPLTVFLSGQGVRGVGQLQVTVQNGRENTTYTRRVPLSEGNVNETQRFALDFRSSDISRFYSGSQTPTIAIQLLVDGRKIAEKNVKLAYGSSGSSFNVLALTRDGNGMNFLLRKKLGLIHRGVNPNEIANAQPNIPSKNSPIITAATTQVYTTDPRTLPGMAQAYDAIDAVVLGDLPYDTLAESQLNALKQYVRQGGLLVVSGGADLTRLTHPFMADLLPIAPGSPSTVSLSELKARYNLSPSTLGNGVGAIGGKLKPGAELLLGTDATKLVTSKAYGAGKVVYLSFDALTPEMRAWRGAAPFWRDVLRSGNNLVSATRTLGGNQDSDRYYGYNSALADSLAGKQATNAPALSTVGGFIGLYILLLVPVSYIVLKKLDKREWSWITAPILIVGFSGVSYAIASNIKGGMLTVNSAVVYEGFANSDQWGGYAQMTLYSPKRAAYDISMGAPDANSPYADIAPSEVQASNFQNAVSDLTVAHDKTTTLKNTNVRLWDKRSFEVPVVEDLGGGIEARTRMVGKNREEVTVTNRTKYTLHDCALKYRDQVVKMNNLAPGQTRTHVLPLTAAGKDSDTANIPGGYDSGQTADMTQPDKVTDAITRRTIEAALATALGQAQMQGMYYGNNGRMVSYGSELPVFTGWFDEPTLDIRVNGDKPAGVQVNLLYVNLPSPANAPQALRKADNPFRQKPVLDLPENAQGDFQP